MQGWKSYVVYTCRVSVTDSLSSPGQVEGGKEGRVEDFLLLLPSLASHGLLHLRLEEAPCSSWPLCLPLVVFFCLNKAIMREREHLVASYAARVVRCTRVRRGACAGSGTWRQRHVASASDTKILKLLHIINSS